MTVPVTSTTDVMVSLSRLGDGPTLSLITPDGVVVTPDNLPEGIGYQEVITYTQGSASGCGCSACKASASEPVDVSTATTSLDGVTFAEGQQSVIRQYSLSNPDVVAEQAALAMETAHVMMNSAETRVRVLHAAAGAPAVDVTIGAAHAVSDLDFGAITEYANVMPDTYAVQVTGAGGGTVLAEATLEALIGSDYTIAVTGAAPDVSVQIVADENGMPSKATGEASLRVVHLSPDTGWIDVGLTGLDPLVTGVAFRTATEQFGITAGVEIALDVRDSGDETVLVTLPAQVFEENHVYTLFVLGLSDGAPALQALLTEDATPPARLRLLHATAGVSDVDVYADDVRIYSDLPFGWHTEYLALQPGSHNIQVMPAGMRGPILLDTTLELTGGTDVTLVAAGASEAMQGWELADDNQLPAVEQSRLRLVHASSGAPAVDLAVVDGATLFASVGYQDAPTYLSLDAGTYNFEVREAGGETVLLTIEDVVLDEGDVNTLALLGLVAGEPDLALVPTRDRIASGRATQSTFVINQAQTGDWQVKLGGYLEPDASYQLVVFGAVPEPALSGVVATSTSPTTLDVSYRLTSDRPGSLVSIYANGGAITTTHVITNTEGITETVVTDAFYGVPLATGLEPAYDGSLQTESFSLAALPSGDYHIWVEADDGVNEPTRIYASEVVTVVSPWEDTWTANVQAVPTYGQIEVSWDPCPFADVDSYAIYLGTEPGAPTETIVAGHVLTRTIGGPQAGQTYYLSVGAYDERATRETLSEEISVTASVAEFTLDVSPATPVIQGGEEIQIDLTLTTALDPYPENASLYVSHLPDGLSLDLDEINVAPTQDGAIVPATLAASDALPAGDYTITLEAHGGGVVKVVELVVTVRKPYFTLAATPASVVLAEGENTAVILDVAGFDGETDEVLLMVENPPVGLVWELSASTAFPGESVTLTLEDSDLLSGGSHTLHVVGTDGQGQFDLGLSVTVEKSDFGISPVGEAWKLALGRTGTFGAEVWSYLDWTDPVTLTVDAESLPDGVTVTLQEAPPAVTLADGSIIVMPATQVELIISVASDATPGSYVLALVGESGERWHSVNLPLTIYEPQLGYLPAIRK